MSLKQKEKQILMGSEEKPEDDGQLTPERVDEMLAEARKIINQREFESEESKKEAFGELFMEKLKDAVRRQRQYQQQEDGACGKEEIS